MATTAPPPELLAALNEGVANHRVGMLDAAEMSYRRALSIAPDDHNALRLLTGLAIHRENWPAALDFARRAVERQPRHGELHRLLAIALMETGDAGGAIAMAERALELGDGPAAKLVLANARLRNGDAASAKMLYREILRRAPGDVAARVNLGKLLLHEGQLADGEEQLNAALTAEPNHVDALRTLAAHYAQTDRLRLAARYFGRATTLTPGDIDLQSTFATTLLAIGNHAQAILSFRAVLGARANDVDAQIGLASALAQAGHIAPARRYAAQILERDPDNGSANYVMSLVQRGSYQMQLYTRTLERIIAAGGATGAVLQNYAFRLLQDETATAEKILKAHLDWAERFANPISRRHPPRAPRGQAGKKLRVGYVSGDFRRHSMDYFMAGPVEYRSREAFEVFCYHTSSHNDAVTARFRHHADHWRDVVDIDDEGVAAMIERDQIDILVDMSGFSSGNRLLVFARRPAPIQMAWLGYVGTTAMEAMDWRITDADADPPGESERHYTERLLRLEKGLLTFKPPAIELDPGPAPALARGFVTFGCFNNMAKIEPGVLDCWGAILAQLPGARLRLKDVNFANAEARAHMLEALVARGIGAERIDLLPHADQATHLASYRDIDIALDCFPYSGCTTSCEALWMGVPLVTMTRPLPAAQVSASLLRRIGLPELVTHDHQGYISLAVGLARDRQRLARLRGEIRGRLLASPICDGPAYVAALEGEFRRIWSEAVAARDGAASSGAAS